MKKTPRRNPKASAPELDESAPLKASARAAERAATVAAKERELNENPEQERSRSEAAIAASHEPPRQRSVDPERSESAARQQQIRQVRVAASEANADVAIREKLAAQGIQALSGAPLIDGPDTVKIEPRRQRPRSVAVPGSGRVSAYEPIPIHSRRAIQAMQEQAELAPQAYASAEEALLDSDAAAMAPSKLRRISTEPATAPSAAIGTLAHRLDALRLARLENPEQSSAIEPRDLARSIAGQAKDRDPSTRNGSAAPRARTAAAGTRNAAVGIAVSYMEEFERHIAGPLVAVWRHKKQFALGIFNIAMIFALTYFFAHVSLTSRAIFLEGSPLAQLGALCWLTVLCAFLWWGLCLVAGRMARAVFFDWLRFERIGSAYFKEDEGQ